MRGVSPRSAVKRRWKTARNKNDRSSPDQAGKSAEPLARDLYQQKNVARSRKKQLKLGGKRKRENRRRHRSCDSLIASRLREPGLSPGHQRGQLNGLP